MTSEAKLDKAKRIIHYQTGPKQPDWLSMRVSRYYAHRQISEERETRQVILGTLIKRGEVERVDKGLKLKV